MKNSVITLLTDFGTKDHYVASMKGTILRINPKCTLIDITHHVSPHDINEGAFILANAYSFFPKGTIHLSVVDPLVGSPRRPILIVTPNYLFVGPDNGLFTFALKREKVNPSAPRPEGRDLPSTRAQAEGLRVDPERRFFTPPSKAGLGAAERVKKVVALTNQKFFLSHMSTTFHGRDLFAPVAAYLSLGVKPNEFGPELNSWVELDFEKPRIRRGKLTGEILHIDAFGNLISNINKEELFHFVKDHPFVNRIGGRAIQGLKKGYWEGKRNEPMALMGSGGFLEISVREGNAQKMLKVKKGDRVTIEIDR